jgi:hypothetical protein
MLVAEFGRLIQTDSAGFACLLSGARGGACQAGAARHVISGTLDEGLLEVFSNHGLRTRIMNDASAFGPQKKDVRRWLLTAGHRGRGLGSAPGDHRKEPGRLLYFEIDMSPVACVALRYVEQNQGELACLCRLIARVKASAQAHPVCRSQGARWAEELLALDRPHVLSVERRALSKARRRTCHERLEKYAQSGRRSKVLSKLR